MVAKTSFIALCVATGLALGDAPKPGNPARAKPKVIDLDFTDDGENWTAAPKTADKRESRGRWIYWAVGAGVAAAGGTGWYLFQHSQDRQNPKVKRNEQVFTDER